MITIICKIADPPVHQIAVDAKFVIGKDISPFNEILVFYIGLIINMAVDIP